MIYIFVNAYKLLQVATLQISYNKTSQ